MIQTFEHLPPLLPLPRTTPVPGPRKIIIKSMLSPGDVIILTAAVRDLHKSCPKQFITDVSTSCSQIWDNNPYITKLDEADPTVELIEAHYPLINRSNTSPFHFIHGYMQDLEVKLGVRITPTEFKGDVHLSNDERNWISQVEELQYKGPFWIVVAGGKFDFTAKWWNPEFFQEVINHFRQKIVFVQCGQSEHWHKPLANVINFLGKTDTRQFLRLVYHSVGVLCPVTFVMHAAAAVPVKPGRSKNRACVVVAGGREPSQWEAYPHHQYLHTNGALFCCDNGGCWKARCQPVGDGDAKDKDLCVNPVKLTPELQIPKCMQMIRPEHVITAIERYYEGGVLH